MLTNRSYAGFLKLTATEDSLTISVDAAQRKYKELESPAKVDPQKAMSSYKNGLLEVKLAKKEKDKSKGEPPKID
ncbi:MAG: Hsp20 family protein [Candidatus Atabeyarchaeum deiterrae]